MVRICYTVLCIKANEGSSAVMSVVVHLVNLMLFLSYLGQYREARLKIIERKREREHFTWSHAVQAVRLVAVRRQSPEPLVSSHFIVSSNHCH